MSRHCWTSGLLIVFMFSAAPLGCASRHVELDRHPTIENFSDGSAIENYRARLGRIMMPNPDGSLRPGAWSLRVPEDFVRDAIGPSGVDACLKNVQAGGFSCKTQLSGTVDFRMILIEGEVSWWMELGAAKPPFSPRKWHFGSNVPGAINGWETR